MNQVGLSWSRYTILFAGIIAAMLVVMLSGHSAEADQYYKAMMAAVEGKGRVAVMSRAEARKKDRANRREVKTMLIRLGHSEYYEGMRASGLDRVHIIARADDQDRDELMIKHAHWRRIVAAAKAILYPAPATPSPTTSTMPNPPQLSPPSPPPPSQQRREERFLMVSTMTAGFASGVRTQLVPFLAVAAKAGMTAVLPAGSFGIPAFRSTTVDPKQGFVPLSYLLDIDELRSSMPCVDIITHEEWMHRTNNTVDSVLFLGSEKEIGTALAPGSAPQETLPLAECFPKFLSSLHKTFDKRDLDPFWNGPWEFWGETAHVIRSQKMKVGSVKCGGLQAMVKGATFLSRAGPLNNKRTVMIANFPGLIRDSFWWHSPHNKEKELALLFKDTPHKICGTHPGFTAWPSIAKHWKAAGKKVVKSRFGGNVFTCVHIRGEKLVLKAVKDGKATIKTLGTSDYMKRCIKGVVSIVQKTMKGSDKAFVISDLNPETGSPSAARDRFFKAWMGWADKEINENIAGQAYCGTPDVEKSVQTGSAEVRNTLKNYPGNCAIGEAAICQDAESIVRFGKGSMGAFVAGSHEVQQYETCEDVFKAL
eukprot:TRINITY_DN17159_c0_g1_i1.p1 TRINITY_DN17159_c0_g1~~TRINITY_DN17159_c0_g1_i1.p1  ORF type:complete len:593 (+),score=98.27 TRINITY_DN17159_c0_g1_i1:51-1829(+)